MTSYRATYSVSHTDGSRHKTSRDGPWIALDTALLRNAKIASLTAPAFRLFIAGLCHAGDELTDGVVGLGALRVVKAQASATAAHMRELLEAGLWAELPDGGYVAPGYLDWNPPRAWLALRRERDARRQREWRAKALKGGRS